VRDCTNLKILQPEEIEESILKHARPVHRILVFTEESGDWEKIDTIELAKSLDPKFDRSYFVFSDFEKHLHKFNSSRDLNKFLASNIVDSKVYSYPPLPFIPQNPTLSKLDFASSPPYLHVLNADVFLQSAFV
jgi:hypothetical protein